MFTFAVSINANIKESPTKVISNQHSLGKYMILLSPQESKFKYMY